MSEENPIYVKTSDKENLILSMLAISQKMSGTLPTKSNFYDSLKDLDVDPSPEFIEKVKKNFAGIGL